MATKDDELIAAFNAFRLASHKLCEVWHRNGDDSRLDSGYPFNGSFEEVDSDICDWWHTVDGASKEAE